MQVQSEKNPKIDVRSGIRTHASIRRPEIPIIGRFHLESGALDHSAILTLAGYGVSTVKVSQIIFIHIVTLNVSVLQICADSDTRVHQGSSKLFIFHFRWSNTWLPMLLPVTT